MFTFVCAVAVMTSILTIRVSFVLGSEPSRKHESNALQRVYSPADLLLDELNLAIMFCCLSPLAVCVVCLIFSLSFLKCAIVSF